MPSKDNLNDWTDLSRLHSQYPIEAYRTVENINMPGPRIISVQNYMICNSFSWSSAWL